MVLSAATPSVVFTNDSEEDVYAVWCENGNIHIWVGGSETGLTINTGFPIAQLTDIWPVVVPNGRKLCAIADAGTPTIRYMRIG